LPAHVELTLFSAHQLATAGMRSSEMSTPDLSSTNRWVSGKKLGMTISTATGMCGSGFGVAADDNQARYQEVIQYAVGYLEDMVEEISNLFSQMMKYTDGENEVLRHFMRLDFWTPSTDLSKEDYVDFRKRIGDNVEKALIKELLSSSRCYLECNHRDDAPNFW